MDSAADHSLAKHQILLSAPSTTLGGNNPHHANLSAHHLTNPNKPPETTHASLSHARPSNQSQSTTRSKPWKFNNEINMWDKGTEDVVGRGQ